MRYFYYIKGSYCLLFAITINGAFQKADIIKIPEQKNDLVPIFVDIRIDIWQGEYYKMREFCNPGKARETGGDKLIHTEVMLGRE